MTNTPNTQDAMRVALEEVAGCFEAAYVEGLADALAETADERLKDLVQRRLMYANTAAITALSAQPYAVQPTDADQNAPWLTLAHTICSDAGIPVGHITDRLNALRDRLDAAQPIDAQPATVAAISEQEMAAFNRFCECVEDADSGGYDVPKVMMRRLAEIGLVRPAGFGRYWQTEYGLAVRSLEVK